MHNESFSVANRIIISNTNIFNQSSKQSMIIYAKTIIPSEQRMLKSLLFFGGEKIYTKFGPNFDPNYIRTCEKSAIKLLKTTATTLCLLVTCNCVYFIFPMYALLLKHEIQFPLPVFLPFTEFKGTVDILLNVLIQMYMSLFGIVGNIGIEVMTSIIKNTVWATSAAVCYSIDVLSNSIEQRKSATIIDDELRAISIQVQDYDRQDSSWILHLAVRCMQKK